MEDFTKQILIYSAGLLLITSIISSITLSPVIYDNIRDKSSPLKLVETKSVEGRIDDVKNNGEYIVILWPGFQGSVEIQVRDAQFNILWDDTIQSEIRQLTNMTNGGVTHKIVALNQEYIAVAASIDYGIDNFVISNSTHEVINQFIEVTIYSTLGTLISQTLILIPHGVRNNTQSRFTIRALEGDFIDNQLYFAFHKAVSIDYGKPTYEFITEIGFNVLDIQTSIYSNYSTGILSSEDRQWRVEGFDWSFYRENDDQNTVIVRYIHSEGSSNYLTRTIRFFEFFPSTQNPLIETGSYILEYCNSPCYDQFISRHDLIITYPKSGASSNEVYKQINNREIVNEWKIKTPDNIRLHHYVLLELNGWLLISGVKYNEPLTDIIDILIFTKNDVSDHDVMQFEEFTFDILGFSNPFQNRESIIHLDSSNFAYMIQQNRHIPSGGSGYLIDFYFNYYAINYGFKEISNILPQTIAFGLPPILLALPLILIVINRIRKPAISDENKIIETYPEE
ncbi:MAG: hypothetical protein ACXAC2_05405 [Candidatus Kariarchaeaceae archaeon]|jgi:hypothetical protein